ncbi:MAG: EF-hand domain-containing protein [Verrucomicrobiota bacterium]
MKTIPVSSLVAGMLFSAISHVQAAPPAEEPGKGGPHALGEAWKQADQDHDGKISLAEFKGMPRVGSLPEEKQEKIFKRLDKDDDGSLSQEEISGFGRPRDGMRRLWELDVDKSCGISLEEFKQGQLFKKLPAEKLEGLFRRLDTNSDGLITPKDKPEPPPHRGGRGEKGKKHGKKGPREGGDRGMPERMIQTLDQNADGKLSFEEFRVGPPVKNLSEDEQEDRFEKLDRNQDKAISAEDFPPPPPPKMD